MDQPINEFVIAWNSLSGSSEQDGWQSIPISHSGTCKFMAARRFPGNSESMLTHFPSVKIPLAEKLPEGHGFIVERVDPYGDGKTWLALTRRESGSVELFVAMVSDVVGAMSVEASYDAGKVLRIFLGRLRAWQEFMRKGALALGPEAEIGLIGELYFLSKFINAGVSAVSVVESWMGPLDGIQDFEIGTGAVEVKTSISTQSFLAKIGSIEQLDDSLRQPLFLAGLRLSQTESGLNLPEFVEAVLTLIKGDSEAERVFSEKILAAGYFIAHADRYPRRFSVTESRIIEVKDGFPRIIPGTVPAGIKRVIYEIDLDKILGNNLELSLILKKLGVL